MTQSTWVQARPEAFSESIKWAALCTCLKELGIDIDEEYELRTLIYEWATQRIRSLRESRMLGDK